MLTTEAQIVRVHRPRPSTSRLPRPQRSSPYGALFMILKITERCNLACPYCYMFFMGDESYREHPPLMSTDTLAGLVGWLQEAVHTQGLRSLHIGLHGGEPLLMNKKAFRQLCAALREGLAGRCRLQLSMQTNGVLIDEAWIEIFSQYDIGIGMSMDGDESLHNLTRVTRSGRGTYRESRRGWELLQQAAAQGRLQKPGILCVVSPGQPAGRIYQHFAQELRASSVNFLLPDFNHDSPEVSPALVQACGDYMLEVCRAWFAGQHRPRVRFIRHVVNSLLDDESCQRLAANQYNPFELITVSSNGDISPDDAIRVLAPRFRETGHTVQESTMSALMDSDAWLEIYASQGQLPAACTGCLWQRLCRGGAPQHRFSAARGFDNPSIYCEALKRIYAFIASMLVQGGVSAEAIEHRLTGPLPTT
ncbi:radical SAM protein [Mitsuaria sp. WAJ17]|uniref:radical SAM protein n=1 Tax=Mitsuaria sp. WAJ17 TaxID=2761452 RepID=UPI00160145D5|nr:radical SAM protein [Mitsuaria sp. WAJ17]MBB2484689.1 radical SAM protein [Mitsuaria sp. WAJ17]